MVRTTGAFSWNVGKLFSELKLVSDNLLFSCYSRSVPRLLPPPPINIVLFLFLLSLILLLVHGKKLPCSCDLLFLHLLLHHLFFLLLLHILVHWKDTTPLADVYNSAAVLWKFTLVFWSRPSAAYSHPPPPPLERSDCLGPQVQPFFLHLITTMFHCCIKTAL